MKRVEQAVVQDAVGEDAVQSESQRFGPEEGNRPNLVLGIGGSGAHTESLLRLLRLLPPRADLAIVVILSNREALNEAAFREALGDGIGALLVPSDGDLVERGHIYLPPPDVIVTLEENRFRLRPAEGEPGERGTMDSFLVSLAGDRDGDAVGLVLEGAGADGTLGLVTLKESGGLALAEGDPEAAEVAEKTAAALADAVLPVEEVPERLALHGRNHARARSAQRVGGQGTEDDSRRLAQVAAVLRERTGHDFHGYKRATFSRRVSRRMQVTQASNFAAYLDILRSQPDEPQLLFNDLLIGVTQFFRDHREFRFLETHVIPQLFEGKNRSDHLRVWVLGCSTGEEAYSLAILLREHAAKLPAPPQIQLFASDIDARALAVARVGRYPSTIARDVTPERLARWFVEEGETYCVARELREICIFSQHSIVRDPPFSRLDLVSCRNLLIYLGAELQSRVIPLFHFALKPGGFLFLGNAENVSRHANLFEPMDRAYRIFRRSETEARVLPDFPYTPVARISTDVAVPPRPQSSDEVLPRQVERIAERYAPAYAVVNERFEVLHFSPKAGRYIHPAAGAASLNLLALVNADLRLDLGAALSRALTEEREVEAVGLFMREAGGRIPVDLTVEPVPEGEGTPRTFVVLFRERIEPPPELHSRIVDEEHVHKLESELRVTRERLQTMIEELQSTNEELKSSNEEYQSLNEELQSANEELQTSKEELQSVNEEVTTVNSELAQRVQELSRANSDLKNLLESTQIPTIFLDNELRVTNFTPAAADIFHLVETDTGRPIAHIKSRISYDELPDDARRVIRTLAAVDREIENPTTRARYIVRILPYRSVDNFIGGAVVTFTDVTPVTRAEQARRESEERLRLVTGNIPQLVWTALDEGRWTWTSRQWREYTGQSEEESLGRGWMVALHPDDRSAASDAWAQARAKEGLDVEYRVRSRDGIYRWFHSRAMPLEHEDEQETEWFGTSTDVHEMRELREQQGILVSELQHRSRNLLGIVSSVASRTIGRGGSAEDFEDRLAALSRVQGLLSRSGNDSVELGALVRAELEAHGSLEPPKVTVNGPEVSLTVAQVQTFALALHELATNAVKYGALKGEAGRLSVTWTVEAIEKGRPSLLLDWSETGLALGAEAGTHRGYGRELIERALTFSLGAQIEYAIEPGGVRCRVRLPLS
ncbi:CheR family methyltransferase [Roseomonas elaeocarpi]|uniref:CheR family methyltransferase n=1 Tax=Roseomonas elaeocarpi TaxID=907779 RepID=A0ABV6JPR6_9PROT